MDRGKRIAIESFVSIREFVKWTAYMDFHLLSATIDKACMGNRVDGSWTTQAYNNIVMAFHQLELVGITKYNTEYLKDFERHMMQRL